jgi:acyl transferase domain-containing protein
MTTTGLEIAIIGMTGRFPGAPDLDTFWNNLKQGVESISTYSDEQLKQLGIEPDLLNHPHYVKAGAHLEDIDQFDAEFFGFNPREAEILDPQQRLFLEASWEALEQAGYDSEQYSGAIAVYAGAAINSYLLNLYTNPTIQETVSPYQLFLSSDKDFLTTRVSYKLNLKGPSVDVQTACSTSLVAVHIACQSLLSGECDLALAGGVAVSQQTGYLYQEGGIYSPDGHCRAFDANAQGTVSGSGLGIIVLKRLDEAVRDRDTIHAIIKGSAINNDGGLKVSYTAPSLEAQAQVIRTAQMMAEVEPATIAYIEAHGTGTALGDPIEIAALTQAFGNASPAATGCAIGSVKTNIGHLDTAAGIASLIKTTLALKHAQIPPSLHFQQPNPHIDLASFHINTQLTDWQGATRRAGVSSFGIGGTNAHVILESAPPTVSPAPARSHQLLLLSAKTPTALDSATDRLVHHLQNHDVNLADIAHTLHIGRRAFDYRRHVVCATPADVITALTSIQRRSHLISRRAIAFMFPGQGTQYMGMGRDLYQTEPSFRTAFDRCCDLLRLHLKLDLRDVLYAEDSATDLTATAIAQPVLFAVEYALAQLWMSWGIEPEAMIGHSIGEYVAACLAGVFSLEDALKIVSLRGQLMQQQQPGSMLSVALSVANLQPWLEEFEGKITIAAINAPELSVVSGAIDAIAQFQRRLGTIPSRLVHTSHAFHSPQMEPVLSPFLAAIQSLSLYPPRIPFISNVTGTWITDADATDAHYWVQHLRQPVRFSEGISHLSEMLLLEVGAGQTLSTFAKQALGMKTETFSSLHHAQEKIGDVEYLLNTAGKLWTHGANLDGTKFYQDQSRSRIPLPTYPFERQRYWVSAKSLPNSTTSISSQKEWLYEPAWKRDRPSSIPDLTTPSRWLLFTDASPLGVSLAQTLQQSGQDVVTVSRGDRFTQSAYRSFTLDPHQADQYSDLLQDLQLRELLPDRILYLWSLESELENLLFLTQSIASLNHPMRLTVITNQVQDVTGEEAIDPTQSAVLGFCSVISQEYPHLSCQCIDLHISGEYPLVHQILAEAISPEVTPVVAYRGCYRWQQSFVSAAHDSSNHPRLSSEAHYLIVGDTQTGLGKVWAAALTQHLQAKITIVGSTPLPEGRFIAADITNFDEMEAAIAQAEAKSGAIHGVFYSTPMSNARSMALISELTPDHWEYNLQTKVRGLTVLAAVLQQRSPAFCLLQSSLSSVVGGLGLATYAAANRCIDSFVQQQMRRSPSTAWFSVNWDQLASEADNSPGFAANLSELSLSAAEIWTMTQKILSNQSGQIIVSKIDLLTRIHQAAAPPALPELNSHTRPNLAHEYIAPQTETEQAIAQIWQELLGIDRVGIHDSFFELGGHSLLAIQALSRLRSTFQVDLPMRSLLFEAPTIAGIAALVVSQQPQPDELAAMAEILSEVQNLSPEQVQQLTAIEQ